MRIMFEGIWGLGCLWSGKIHILTQGSGMHCSGGVLASPNRSFYGRWLRGKEGPQVQAPLHHFWLQPRGRWLTHTGLSRL